MRLRASIILAYLWIMMILLGSIVMETFLIYPNVFDDPPRSLEVARAFMQVRAPSDYFPPLGFISWMMGTFFTVPQDRPAERTRIFQRAERILRRTGESVYLSPEGARITTGQIGHFNKGAFHLATNLQVPIVPFFIDIPPDVDPGRGIAAHPGVIDVTVMPAIDTRAWTIDDLEQNKERVRDLFVSMQRRR